MNLWTLTKTAAALVSIGILLTPALRRLGYLPDDAAPAPKRVGSKSKRPARIAETPAELTAPVTASANENTGSRRSHH